MKLLERSSQPPGTDLGHDVLIAVTMGIALTLVGTTIWIWSCR
jgi:hypothetical protein